MKSIVTRSLSVAALALCSCADKSGDNVGDGSDSGISATADDDGAETQGGEGTADPGDGTAGGGGTTAGVADEDAGAADSPPVNFDLGGIPDAPENTTCGGEGNNGNGEVELSYIWVANSAQGTISKIDTVTMAEEGRYVAKPAGGDPSRTSVNLNGDVAVANRNGGVAKFWADPKHCVDSNGTPGIQTATDSTYLPWEEDDCLAWYTPLTCSSNRPVAWTRGDWSPAACSYSDAKLWTACDSNVLLLDGETGMVEETIPVPSAAGGYAFVYGGAADADGNFWGLDTANGAIFRVDFADLSTGSWALPPNGGYGITVDPEGRPWVCGGGWAARFNLDDSTWSNTPTTSDWGIGGCMTDGVSTLWHCNQAGTLLGFDIETLDVVEQIQLPEYVHGVSVDFYGNVWGVSFAGSNAYRANPASGQVDTFSGLTGAYTYSDMTGFALSSAGGGGVPSG